MTKSKWLQKQKEQGAFCRYCGTPRKLTVDHIVPRARGGINDPQNYQILCKYCNGQKGALTEVEVASIFRDIQARGVWYDWEKKYHGWLKYLEIKRKEYKL